MARSILSLLSAALLLAASANAQFNFFDQMFQGQQRQQPQNVASDSSWYQENYNNGPSNLVSNARRELTWSIAYCDKYLCPDTLACVAVPHHCPCAHPLVEDKVELGDGKAVCISKGGFKAGEAARKIELARKGLI
jgi:hypothetical protein